ncbi:MAG: tetratricopeptide repeat protein [Bacteroidetes bacterium]|nr:tetratricopeptide repeat protein [Bacteroidota bacterium]
MMSGTVHPKEFEDVFKALRIHPDELTEAHIIPFVPTAAKVEQSKDKRLGALSRIIADAATIQAAATWILENEDWEFMAVYFDAIDHFCHGFMKFHPPQLPGIPDDLFNIYKDVVVSGYKFHDMMLERLLKLAGDDITVMVISDHGFHSDHLRPLSLPKEPAAPALEHSPFGIYVLKGDHILEDERIYGASVLDITPTLLNLFGLPVGEDMDGKVLVQIFKEQVQPEVIPSWEDVDGNSGMHENTKASSIEESEEVLQQLVDLGYIEKPDENANKAQTQTLRESNYNLARVYLHAGKFKEALPLLEQLYKDKPDANRFGLRLATCYQSLNLMKECREVIEKIRDRVSKEAKEKKKISPALDLLEGTLLLAENKPQKALEHFKKTEKEAPQLPKLHLQIGRGYLLLKQHEDAERAFLKTLAIDGDNSAAFHGLAVSLLRRGRNEEAVEQCLNSIGLIYHFPFAHYHLGEALYNLGDYERSAQAFEVCLTMAPNVGKARQKLIEIYENKLKRSEEANKHHEFFESLTGKVIYIVSGLPRSGTSMMMQMLVNGGMEAYSDEVRKADESNPKGYYEHESVKSLARNKKWVNEANGKVVKVISQLLQQLPMNHLYKIVFMNRDVREVVMSQQKMLALEGKADPKNYPIKIDQAYRENLTKIKEWAKRSENVEILYVDYPEVLANPMEQAKKIHEFLGYKLNTDQMIAVVDPELYRTKMS